MARRDALLRLHQTLVARRDDLRKRLGGELNGPRADTMGDVADMAFDAGSEEVNSQIAEFESRELAQIELSLQKLRKGTYGTCEGCAKKIPVARLNALPFSSTCIACARELEMFGTLEGRQSQVNWDKIRESGDDAREYSISDLEMEIPTR